MSSSAPTVLADSPSLKADATVISLVGFAHGTSHFFHFMLPSLFPWLMVEFKLGFAEVGLLTTVFYVVSSMGQAVAGVWVDRHGAFRVLCFGVSMLSFSGVVVALAPNFAGIFVGVAIAGIGNSIFHPSDYAILAKRVSTNRMGHAFSTHGISGNLGWALGPIYMTAIAAQAGWRIAALGAAVFGAVALALLVWKRDLLKYELANTQSKSAPVAPGTWSFLVEPMVWYAFAFFAFATFGFGALQNFAPTVLRELFSLSLAASISALSIYLVGASVGLVLGGFLAKPGNRHERTVMLAFALGASFALVLAFAPLPTWLVLPIMALMGFGTGIAGPSRDLLVRSATKARLGEGAFGRVYGMVYSGLDVGLALAPIVFGMLLDRNLPGMVFVGVAASLSIAIVAAAAVAHSARGAV